MIVVVIIMHMLSPVLIIVFRRRHDPLLSVRTGTETILLTHFRFPNKPPLRRARPEKEFKKNQKIRHIFGHFGEYKKQKPACSARGKDTWASIDRCWSTAYFNSRFSVALYRLYRVLEGSDELCMKNGSGSCTMHDRYTQRQNTRTLGSGGSPPACRWLSGSPPVCAMDTHAHRPLSYVRENERRQFTYWSSCRQLNAFIAIKLPKDPRYNADEIRLYVVFLYLSFFILRKSHIVLCANILLGDKIVGAHVPR